MIIIGSRDFLNLKLCNIFTSRYNPYHNIVNLFFSLQIHDYFSDAGYIVYHSELLHIDSVTLINVLLIKK